MLILFNGRAGIRQYRLLVFLVNGELYMLRPYVGWYQNWPEGCEVFGQALIGDFNEPQ
ncbi:MAG: hypothetical protein ACXADW_16670 [Candidatus Hodarchaeales archaeon]